MSQERPEYGEYATPEEQAEAMGVEAPAVATVVEEEPSAAEPLTPGRRRDRVITILLLLLGVYSTVSSFASYTHFSTLMDTAHAAYGYDKSYPDPALADSLGFVLNVVRSVIVILAIWLSIRRMRAGRLAFLVPLIGAVIVTVGTGVVIGILFAHDPGFADFLSSTITKGS